MNATKTAEITNLRWATDTGRAYAWIAGGDNPKPFCEVTADASDSELLDGLRAALCRHFRSPEDSAIVNDLGHRINVGGGYR